MLEWAVQNILLEISRGCGIKREGLPVGCGVLLSWPPLQVLVSLLEKLDCLRAPKPQPELGKCTSKSRHLRSALLARSLCFLSAFAVCSCDSVSWRERCLGLLIKYWEPEVHCHFRNLFLRIVSSYWCGEECKSQLSQPLNNKWLNSRNSIGLFLWIKWQRK